MRNVFAAVAVGSLYFLGAASVRADMAEPAKAARGMGYANYVYEKSRCDGAIKNEAVILQNDISNLYNFSYDDLLGKTAIGASVNQGRAAARNDEAHPQYKGQFCDSMDEVLSVWRSDVMPSPK